MQEIPKRLKEKLSQRHHSDNLRVLPSVIKNGEDFFSNDYLGLAKEEAIHEAALKKLYKTENINGSTGSRLLSGNHILHQKLEDFLKHFHHSDSALLFNSGYDANIGFFSSVPQRGDYIFYDELIHASIRDGIKMGFAKAIKFKHNDLADLAHKVELCRKKSAREFYVVSETVFSMDGDSPNLLELANYCSDKKLHLVLDEAHAIGVFGNKGEGLVQKYALEEKVFARVVTFGKALGCHGAAILGAESLKKFLINYARSLIYSTSMSPYSVATIQSAYEWMLNRNHLQRQLTKKISLFNDLKNQLELDNFYPSHSAIQSYVMKGNFEVKKASSMLHDKGFLVKAILSPTVPKNKERLRICLHCFNSDNQIEKLLKELKKIQSKFD